MAIGRPNALRDLVYSTVRSKHDRDAPTISAANTTDANPIVNANPLAPSSNGTNPSAGTDPDNVATNRVTSGDVTGVTTNPSQPPTSPATATPTRSPATTGKINTVAPSASGTYAAEPEIEPSTNRINPASDTLQVWSSPGHPTAVRLPRPTTSGNTSFRNDSGVYSNNAAAVHAPNKFDGIMAAPNSSVAMAASTAPPPNPPYSSGTNIPDNPISRSNTSNA